MHSPLGIESSALHLQDAFDESMNNEKNFSNSTRPAILAKREAIFFAPKNILDLVLKIETKKKIQN